MSRATIKKVIHRKLGRENADGLAWKEDSTIEIDERLKGKKHLETVIHEALHILNPEMSETQVVEQSKAIKNLLWKLRYRRAELS
jgi:fructose-specific phosphotransferase system component IIB